MKINVWDGHRTSNLATFLSPNIFNSFNIFCSYIVLQCNSLPTLDNYFYYTHKIFGWYLMVSVISEHIK